MSVVAIMEERDSQPSSLTGAVERVLAGAQRVFVDRVELIRIEAKEDAATTIRGTAMALGGALLLFYGWIVAVAWVAYLLWGSIPLGVALAALAALHLGGGAALTWLGARTLTSIRPLRPDDPETDRREQRALAAGMKGAV